MDAGTLDAGRLDAGVDAGRADAGFDAGRPDAGFDAGRPDAGFDAGRPDAGFDAGRPDAGFDAGRPPCASLPDGTLCGPVLECQESRCRSGACVLLPATTTRLCGLPGPCQPRGLCVSGACVQPPPTACRVGDLQLSLTWDDQGRDLELHLIRPGGRLNDTLGRSDCTWNTCVSSSPDWGVQGDPTDDPVKDVDNVGAFGPENIALNRPAPGVYAVIVEHWGQGQPSTAQLTLKVGTTLHHFNVTGLQAHWVWDVARVDVATGAVTRIDQTFSCQPNWSNGCTLPLP